MSELAAHLDVKEPVLWEGRPPQGLLWRRADWLLLPLSVVGAWLAVRWCAALLATPMPLAMKLPALPVLALALYAVAGRFVDDARRRSRTRYLLTADRLLIAHGRWHLKLTVLPLAHCGEVTLHRHGEAAGSIVFRPPRGERRPPPRLELGPEAAFVHALIAGAQAQAVLRWPVALQGTA